MEGRRAKFLTNIFMTRTSFLSFLPLEDDTFMEDVTELVVLLQLCSNNISISSDSRRQDTGHLPL